MSACDRARAWLAQRGPLAHNENSVVVRDLLALCESLREYAGHDAACSAALNVPLDRRGAHRLPCRCGWDKIEKMMRGEP